MRKTKIVCTLGPASESPEMIANLADAGMNVARLNLSHANHEGHLRRLQAIREVNKKLEFPIGILIDLQGPKIRVGELKPIPIAMGDTLTFTTKKGGPGVFVDYPQLCQDINEGDTILVDDGMLQFVVRQKTTETATCEALNNGVLRPRKSVNLPGVHLHLPAITEKDKEDIRFAIEHHADYLALSFVKSPQDVARVRKLVGGAPIQLIAKIECVEAVKDFDAILAAVDGVMIARGDLGVEVPLEKVPLIQFDIIKKCNAAGKPVITATHLLNSMIDNPRPTRAEVSDVTNAIFTGTDAVMLSAETASGSYPLESVKTLDRIARETETRVKARLHRELRGANVGEIVAKAVALVADNIHASAILTVTQTGLTARALSAYRVRTPIFAVTTNEGLACAQLLRWGVYSIFLREASTAEAVDEGIAELKRRGHVHAGDLVVLTAGVLDGGTRNYAEVRVV